ncbi:MAG: fumarylacetoacetate hydrolase family protein, partial [Silvibacterium sp.]|nr:fumarylacetoacetate hydrolase family protein [Silvibacterium sp.]
MKYCRFQTESGPQYGAVADLAGNLWIERLLPPFEEDPQTQPFAGSFEPVPLYSAKLLTPVVPSKIVCVGRNYREHAAELGNEPPKEPLIFLKAPSSLIGPEETIRIPPQSERVDFEGELAIVVGRRAYQIGQDEPVASYIRGYTIVNDVTARDLQKTDGQW